MKRHIGTPAWRDREGVHHLRPTIAECAALQGFRPGLVFHGNAGEQHLIVGNAVPPPLADGLIRAAAGTPARQLAAAA